MTPNVIQIRYDDLQDIAQQFAKQAEVIAELNQTVRYHAENLQTQWVGEGSAAFFGEMETVVYPTGRRLADALQEANRVTLDICAVMQDAEDEASLPFQTEAAGGLVTTDGAAGSGSESPGSSGFGGWWDRVRGIADGIVGAADALDDFLPIPMALLIASSLRLGTTYAGQVVVKAPAWVRTLGMGNRWVKGTAGLSKNLAHIKASNLATHIGKGATKLPLISKIIVAAQGVMAVANTWTDHWAEYGTYDMPRKVTAMGVDAGLSLLPVAGEVAGGMAGVVGGAKLGAAIGTLITPGLGTAVGAVIGGAVGGFAGDWAGGHIGDATQSGIINAGWRDWAIDTIDNRVARPIANGINSTIDAVRDFQVSSVSLPELSFGF